MPYPGLLHPEPLLPQQSSADPYILRRHPNTVLSQSLCGLWVLVCTRYVWALWVSLVGMGFDSKCDFTPPTILLGLLLCPWCGVSPQSLSSTVQPCWERIKTLMWVCERNQLVRWGLDLWIWNIERSAWGAEFTHQHSRWFKGRQNLNVHSQDCLGPQAK